MKVSEIVIFIAQLKAGHAKATWEGSGNYVLHGFQAGMK